MLCRFFLLLLTAVTAQNCEKSGNDTAGLKTCIPTHFDDPDGDAFQRLYDDIVADPKCSDLQNHVETEPEFDALLNAFKLNSFAEFADWLEAVPNSDYVLRHGCYIASLFFFP